MTAPALDDFLLRLAPAAPISVADELIGARDSIRASLATLKEVPDAALEQTWRWRDGDVDVRYGLYRQCEDLEDTRARVLPLVADAMSAQGPAWPLLASASAARWDLHGLLAALDDADLDRDPGNGEWTVRQTLAHIVSGQRAYAWYTGWWLTRRDAPGEGLPPSVPDGVIDLPEEETEGEGSLAEIQSRFDDIIDRSATAYTGLGSADLAAGARWAGLPVDVRFRLGRWASHIREHTIQVEKTLGFSGRSTTEVDRLLRLIAGAYGRLEETLFMLPAEHEDVVEALALAESAAARVEATSPSVAEAARS